MSKKKNLLMYLVAFMILFGNVIFYFYSRLENPLYLKIYSELGFNELERESDNEEEADEEKMSIEPIKIFAIKNADDNENKIIGAELPEFNDMILNIGNLNDLYSTYDFSNEYEIMDMTSVMFPGRKTYIKGKKYIEETELNFDEKSMEDDISKELLAKPITKVRLILKNLKDGNIKKEIVDIGERHIVKRDEDENLNEYAVIGLDDSIWNCVFEIDKEVELKAIEMKSLDTFKKNYLLYVNGKELNNINFPLKIRKNENIAVNIKAKRKSYEKIENQRLIFLINKEGKDEVMKAMFTDRISFYNFDLNDLKAIEKLQG